jgi:microcystin-dependent protein
MTDLSVEAIQNVLGARGLDPFAYPNNGYWSLCESSGVIVFCPVGGWSVDPLGPLPDEPEIALGAAPLISLQRIPSITEGYFRFRATLDGGDDETIHWRIYTSIMTPVIDTPITDNTEAASGVAEVDVPIAEQGTYYIQVWSDGFGFTQLTFTFAIRAVYNGLTVSFLDQDNVELPITIPESVGQAAVGSIKLWPSNTLEDGWLICNGDTLSRATYSALFDEIGILWGNGDGSTTFHLPDLRGAVPLGVSGSHALASGGGSETVTLTESQLPELTVEIPFDKTVGITLLGAGEAFKEVVGIPSNTVMSNPFGGGEAHNNLPPYKALHFVIYTSVLS